MHVLVVEQDPDRQRALTAAIEAAGMRPETAGSAADGLHILSRPTPPDVVLLGTGTDDLRLLDLLEATRAMGGAPPVILVGPEEAVGAWIEATRLGVTDHVVVDADGTYLQTLAGRVQANHERRAEADHRARMADALASTSAAVIIADRAGRIEMMNDACAHMVGRASGSAAGGTLEELFPMEEEPRIRADLFSAVQGEREWAGEVRVRTESGDPVDCLITISPIYREGGRTQGLVLTLRDVSDRVAMEEALRAANRRLADQASRDALTGLYNRGYFHEVLERELARAVRYGDVLSVVMVDLDRFKDVNDLHGHAAGDAVLCEVAAMLRPCLRDGDVLARYGGDEFCVLLPNTPAAAAEVVAQRLCASVASSGYGPDGASEILLSAGIATSEQISPEEGELSDAVLRLADRALYRSKGSGGNVVTIYDPALDR